jgi:hypothetical protein
MSSRESTGMAVMIGIRTPIKKERKKREAGIIDRVSTIPDR